MKSLLKYFLNGLVLTAPVALTGYILWRLFAAVDGWLDLGVPGAGFLATLALVTAVGFVASNFLARRILTWMDDLVDLVPGVRFVYNGIKDVMGAFVGEKKRFGQAVLVTLDATTGMKAIGFLTQDSLAEMGLADHVTVYLPFSYAFTGHTLVLPRELVTPIHAPSAKVMAFVVSGGVAEVGER